MTERTPQIKIRVNTYSLNTNFGQCKINQLHTENSVSRASLNSSSSQGTRTYTVRYVRKNDDKGYKTWLLEKNQL